MTIKTLSGTYASGYSLHSPTTTLSITSAGYVKGGGITTPGAAVGAYTIVNYGKVVATTTGAQGIYLENGGVVTNGSANDTTARISGYRAVRVHKAAGTVTNYGTMTGVARTAVYLDYSGVVTNGPGGDTTATISGTNGVIINYSKALPLATVVNYGTVSGTDTVAADGGVGVYLGAGGVDNGAASDVTAVISGYSGVEIAGLGVVYNYGSIDGFGGKSGLGAYVQRGEITNGVAAGSHATIQGFIGAAEGGAGTITNWGTIIGTGGTSVELQGADETLVVEAGSAFKGAVVGGGGVLALAGGTGTASGFVGGGFTLAGDIAAPASFSGFGLVNLEAPASLTLSDGGTLAATQTLQIAGSLTTDGTLDVAGTLHATSNGLLTLAGALANGGGGLTLDAGSTLAGHGSVALTTLADNGLIDAVGGALEFKGASAKGGDLFAGVLEGVEIDFAGLETLGAGASLTATTVGLFAGATLQLQANQAFAGSWKQGAASVQLGAFTLGLGGTGSTIAGAIDGTGTLSVTGGVTSVRVGAALGVAHLSLAAGSFELATNLTYAGVLGEVKGASLLLGANTLTLTGAGTSFAGAIGGVGGRLLLGGGSQSFTTGAAVGISNWAIQGGAAAAIDERLTYNGTFSLSGATLATGAGDTLSLVGPATFGAGSEIDGTGLFSLYKATLAGLTIGGSATVSLVGTATQSGAVTIGDATSSAAIVSIGKAGVWRLDGDVGIARGTAAGSRLNDAGTLIKSAGTATSVVAVSVTDNGLVEAASGVLDLSLALFGDGRLAIEAGATLELDGAAANTLTLAFDGAGAKLALGDAAVFHVAMSGFAVGDSIDLLKVAATKATLGAGDRLVITDGGKTVAVLQLSGTYTGDTFSVTSDGHAGSNITLTTPGPQGPAVRAVGAFAQQMSALASPAGQASPAPVFQTIPGPLVSPGSRP